METKTALDAGSGQAQALAFAATVGRQAASSIRPIERAIPTCTGDAGSTCAVLDDLGIPFVLFDQEGKILIVSQAADALTERCSESAELWRQARRLAAHALTVAAPGRPFAQRVSSTSLTGVTLHARSLKWGGHPVVLVVLSPDLIPAPAGGEVHGLTPRESEVARLVATARTLKQVAAELSISIHTARRHCERIYSKLGIQSRAELVLLMAGRASAALDRSA